MLYQNWYQKKLLYGDYRSSYKIFKIAFKAFLIIGLIGTLILIINAKEIANNWLEIEETRLTLICLAPSIFFVAISAVLKGYFNGRKDILVGANSQIVEQMFKTFFTIFIVETCSIILTDSYEYLAAGATIATTLATIIGFLYLYIYYMLERKEIRREIEKRGNTKEDSFMKIIKNIVIVTIPMVVTSILLSINRNIDSMTVVRVLKEKVGEENAIKQYGILAGKVETLTTLPLCINVAFSTALIPIISSARAKNKIEYIKEKTSLSILISILIAIPCTLGIFCYAEEILKLLFPMQSEGAELLKISCFTIIFSILNQTVNGILQGIGKGVIPIISLGIGVIFKFILNIILIPIDSIGIKGAAISSILCYMIAFFIEYQYLKKKLKLKLEINRVLVKPIISSIIMIILSKIFYTNILDSFPSKIKIILTIIISILLYIIILLISKILKKEEIYELPFGNILINILKKFKIY